METKQLVALIVAVILSFTTSYAQKVVVEAGKVIIDASFISHTTVPKATRTTGTNSTLCTQDLTDIASEASNAKVYKKFQVAKSDVSINKLLWKEAIDTCADLADDGGGWRLPTQRELMLIWILHPELKTLETAVFQPLNENFYGCATDSKGGANAGKDGWVVEMRIGHTAYTSKYNVKLVRCIREISSETTQVAKKQRQRN